jgi:hypothetical protein
MGVKAHMDPCITLISRCLIGGKIHTVLEAEMFMKLSILTETSYVTYTDHNNCGLFTNI